MVLLCGLEKELRHAEHDEWGNVLREDNPHNLQQLIHLPGQQYDDENPGCTTTATDTIIRDREGTSRRTRWGWRGDGICINTPSIRCSGSTRWDYLKIFLHSLMPLEFRLNYQKQ
ncbi:rhsC element core protein RshC [Salmonella enterica subsp. salamae serovar 58:l,z13,z28:z6 str. 00-0163]|nr:rhsC element core protein RshC [Salmonella enterica subsp. salamae serovar 58:l,z13,z28:z6 str. 00-0163]